MMTLDVAVRGGTLVDRSGPSTRQERFASARARKLHDDLVGFYGDPPPFAPHAFPSAADRDRLLDFLAQGEALIESLHAPAGTRPEAHS